MRTRGKGKGGWEEEDKGGRNGDICNRVNHENKKELSVNLFTLNKTDVGGLIPPNMFIIQSQEPVTLFYDKRDFVDAIKIIDFILFFKRH